MTRFGSDIFSSDFAGDDGTADAVLLRCLEQHASTPSAVTEVALLNALQTARLLVPVVAQVSSLNEDGTEKDSHISQVTFRSADGRIGLPVFTSLESLNAWDAQARPIAQWANAIALSCVESEIDAMLIDMASPHRYALQGISLLQIANFKKL